ncbi:MAG: GGDEF domain-containing protein [Gammaproteobacteria bacterium]|nr:GGDEF domain-containing protein [Gammaproteobacteria bacterium]
MSLVSKLMGSGAANANGSNKNKSTNSTALTDGALDTLSNVLRVMGDESFPLEQDSDPSVFPDMCKEFSCHVENGAGVPSCDIPQSDNGTRQWAHVRRFFADRRKAENQFVTERLNDYRGVVEDLVGGLRAIGERDQVTESDVKNSLNQIEAAVSSGAIPAIRQALSSTVNKVNATFTEQKRQYEAQLEELNNRMSNLREDLVAVREEMKRDALTDAFNRGAFDTAIEQSLNMHFVLNQPVTLIMIDLDNFKGINDTYGHAAGDEVLRSIGECLARSFIRKSDLVARYGGDEFAVILNDTTAQNAMQVVERFLQYVQDVRIPYAPEDTRVTCSAGYTEINANDSVESLIHRADRGLYRAKGEGRNKAVYEPYANDLDNS